MENTSESTEKMANKRRLSPLRNFGAGAVGGMLATIVGQPLDTIKVQLQVLSHTPGSQQAYTGTVDCLQRMIKQGGMRSLFRGMLSPLLLSAPASALSFYSLSLGKRLQLADPEQEPTMVQYMNAGAFCGVVCSFIFAPMERIKCTLQISKMDSQGNPRGPAQVLKEIYRSEGIRGVFRGLPVTMVRDSLGNAAWYFTYEALLKAMRPRDCTRDDVSLASIVFSGGIAGTVFWVLAFPVDNIKTRYQIAPAGKYRAALGVLREVLRTDGVKALYRGYGAAVLRAPVVHIGLFLGYEFTLKTMNKLYP